MATKTVTVSWGKPNIKVRKVGETEWKPFATPVEDSTTLECEQGDKLEAVIEGGTNEAVKYKANKYTLTFEVRQVPERTDPITAVDGVVEDEYQILIEPENNTANYAFVQRASVNVQLSYTAADGFKRTYEFSSLTPDSGEQVEIGTKEEIEALAAAAAGAGA